MKAAATTQGRPAYQIYILLLLLLINAISYADRHLFSILIPSIKAEFGVTDSVLGLIGGPGFTVSFMLFSLPLARLADRWSRRGVLALAATLWSIATAASGIAANVIQLAIARFTVGIGEAGGLPPSQAILATLYGENRRSGVMGVLTSSTYFGLVIGLVGGAAVASQWGWRAAFMTLAVPGFPLALLLWLTGPRRTREFTPTSTKTESGESFWTFVQIFWATKSLRLLAIGLGIFNIFGYAAAVWMPTFFMRSHGMTLVESGAWLGIGASIGGITGSMGGGMLVDHLRKRGEHWQLRLPAITLLLTFPVNVAMFLMPNGASVTIAALHIPVVALLSVVSAILVSVWAGPAYSAVSKLVSPVQRAQATAMLVVVINVIGSITGPTLGGLFSDVMSGYAGQDSLRVSLLLVSFVALIGGAVVWRASLVYPGDLSNRHSISGAG